MSYIDVIIAAYNAEEYLDRCLDSVIDQDFNDIGILVQDGNSTDATVDVLRCYKDSLVYWDSKPDSGIYDAWNKALVHSRAEWVIFLGADDYLWKSDIITRMIPHLQGAYPTYRLVYGKVNRVFSDGTILQTEGREWPWARRRFMDRMSIPHQGVFHHQSLFTKYGFFDDRYKIVGDHEFLLRELKKNDPLFVPEVVVTGMQVGGLSLQTKLAVERWQEYRETQKKHEIAGFRWRWWWGYLRARLRLSIEKIFGKRTANICADFYRRLMGLPRYWTKKEHST